MGTKSNKKTEDAMSTFAMCLWEHAELRSYGKSPEELIESAKQLAKRKRNLDGVVKRKDIGEALAGMILNKIVQFSRDCAAFLRDRSLNDTDHAEGLQFRKAIVIQTIMRLDGVFGINAQKMISIADHFWKNISAQNDAGRDED